MENYLPPETCLLFISNINKLETRTSTEWHCVMSGADAFAIDKAVVT